MITIVGIMLVGCGVSGGMGEPAAPPLPPARFSAPDDGLVEMIGTIGEVSTATRSFTIKSEGRLRYCVLTADANVLNNGHASSLDLLAADQSVTVSGKLHGDVVVTQLLAVGALAAVPGLGGVGPAGGDPLPAPAIVPGVPSEVVPPAVPDPVVPPAAAP